MPVKNVIKQYSADAYYHVYSRGVNKQPIFLDDQDFGYFIKLFKRYLSYSPEKRYRNPDYPHYAKGLDLLGYCIVRNHFHLLIYQHNNPGTIKEFMRSLMTSYSMYFNKRYKRRGPVFESRYKATIIDKESYLDHISRYIHLNPVNWEKYDYSSILFYSGKKHAEWVKPQEILDMFGGFKDYEKFLHDYEANKKMIDELKWEMANL